MRITITTTTGRQSFENVTSAYVTPEYLHATIKKAERIARVDGAQIIDMIIEFPENGRKPNEKQTR